MNFIFYTSILKIIDSQPDFLMHICFYVRMCYIVAPPAITHVVPSTFMTTAPEDFIITWQVHTYTYL